VFAALVAFFLVTGPEVRNSVWFTHGVAVSSQVLGSEPWRAVTALTLHADSAHVLGNAISGSIFAGAVQRRLGSGGAALAVLGSGILGNLGNAVYHHVLHEDHASLGASTAIFGAIGLLAATELVLHRTGQSRTRGWLDVIAPIVGGFALLGALGSGSGDGRTDLGAHLFGFLAGVGIGLGSALPLRRATHAVDFGSGRQGHEVALGAGAPKWWVQSALGGVAAALVVGAWELALRR
jgi:rhomboid protease GluP